MSNAPKRSIAAAVQGAVDSSQTSPGLITAAAAGLVLVFALWWLYFKHSAAEEIRRSLSWTFVWAFAHYLIFAAVAALGAGLQVVIGTLTHSPRAAPALAAFTVAIPVTIYILVLALLSPRGSGEPAAPRPTLLTAAVMLAAAAATPALTLPLSIVIMAVLVALLLAYHLTPPPGQPVSRNADRPVAAVQVRAFAAETGRSGLHAAFGQACWQCRGWVEGSGGVGPRRSEQAPPVAGGLPLAENTSNTA